MSCSEQESEGGERHSRNSRRLWWEKKLIPFAEVRVIGVTVFVQNPSVQTPNTIFFPSTFTNPKSAIFWIKIFIPNHCKSSGSKFLRSSSTKYKIYSKMVDNAADDDVEPKTAKNEASGEGSGDVKPTVNLKSFKVQIPIQARIGKIEEPKQVPIGVVCEARDTVERNFFDKDTNDWWLVMLCGMHNHDLEEKLQGHLIAGRLSAEEKKKVIDMTKKLTVPRNILTNLKENNKESVTTIKQVYNVRTRWRKGERGDMTELQLLISKLVEHIAFKAYQYNIYCCTDILVERELTRAGVRIPDTPLLHN
ncbi:hypothetical protein MTR_1g043440 [Medicago truncatula]|uniref:Uncharacterized protein n=1 Tax=Medicago truncatula TaxID=3880 RepID=G7I5E8_MEDTR|nr:hypothetical protein MTR_1g043440 [Medicago truncatula]